MEEFVRAGETFFAVTEPGLSSPKFGSPLVEPDNYSIWRSYSISRNGQQLEESVVIKEMKWPLIRHEHLDILIKSGLFPYDEKSM